MSFFKKLDKLLTKVEKGGHKAANTAHKWAINSILIFTVYTLYSIGRDYNESFLDARQFEQLQSEGRLSGGAYPTQGGVEDPTMLHKEDLD